MRRGLHIYRNLATVLYDAAMAGLTFMAALYLRWSDAMWVHTESYLWQGTLACSLIMLIFVLYTRLYRRYWRYVSQKDLTTIIKICLATLIVFYGGFFLFTRLEMLPRSVPVIHVLLLGTALVGPRILNRAIHEKSLKRPPESQQVPVLLIGATGEAETFIRESQRNPSFAYRAVGVVATEESSVGRSIHHVKIYGTLEEIPTILRKLKRKGQAAQRMLIATPGLDGSQVRDLVALADKENINIARIPRLSDLMRGDKDPLDIRPIEVSDILGRPQVKLNHEAMGELIADKIVLVTGAGGSIGSELVRQIAAFKPRRIVMLEQNEYALYRIDRELADLAADQSRSAMLGDIRDQKALKHCFDRHNPQIVFHAAALKHVPLCEMNPAEAVLTNAIGTRLVADTCLDYGVDLMVQISTDKAVNPTNVMGACKRIGESYCQALGQSQKKTRFITVRFGNVLGSTGSVVPLFQHQLECGGPLTVTHPDMTRYFMTIREAVQLVIQAASLPVAADIAPIYVLEMGEPIKIDDLARQMIRLAGFRPDEDITIRYTGLRPGEKMHEELFYHNETMLKTEHASILRSKASDVPVKPLTKQLDQLYKLANFYQESALMEALQQAVPEFTPDRSIRKKESA